MRGKRFIDQISLRFNLKIIKSFEARSFMFNNHDYRSCKVFVYIFDNFYTMCFSKHNVAFSKNGEGYVHQPIYKFPIQEKYKILQLISEALSK